MLPLLVAGEGSGGAPGERGSSQQSQLYAADFKKSHWKHANRSNLASSSWKAPPTGIPRKEPIVALDNVLPPGYHLSFFTGTGEKDPNRRDHVQGHRRTGGNFNPQPSSRMITARSIESPLAALGGLPATMLGGYTRGQANAGVVWNQKSALGQSAGMCMMMEPLPKSKRKAAMARPRDTEVRVIPINDYDTAYTSTRPSLTHVGEMLSRVS